MIWCVFFFKQKTAYEMRISDWSSDVCSSDLTVALCMRVLGFDWRETFIYTGAFGVLLLILWLWLYSNPRESGKVSEAELAWTEHDPPEKIGRASCRERVCQYV